MFSKQCKSHLSDVNETALQHMLRALMVAVKLQLLVPVIIIHSIAPRYFTKTTTNVLQKILENIHELDNK